MKLTTRLPSIANDNEAQSTLALRQYILKAWCLIKYQNKWMFIFAFCNSSQYFDVCWPCISVYLSQYLTNLMHKICFTISFISCLYMFRAHVLIIRRSKLHYTASGIITPIGGRLVHGLTEDQRLCNAILTSWWWAHALETCRDMK